MSDRVDTDAFQEKALKKLEAMLETETNPKVVLEISEHLRRLNADLRGAQVRKALEKMSDAEFEKLEKEAGLSS
jgi:hypothetical protein